MASSSIISPSLFLGLSQPRDIGVWGIINRAVAINRAISIGDGGKTPDIGVPFNGIRTTITKEEGLKLTIEIPVNECFNMCVEIFKKLSSVEQKQLVDLYFIKQQEKEDEKLVEQQDKGI